MLNRRFWQIAVAGAAAIAMSTVAGSVVTAKGVNIIYPPKLTARIDKTDVKPAHTTQTRQVIVRVVVPSRRIYRRNLRRIAIHRALGHRYLRFKKVYSGPRYPF